MALPATKTVIAMKDGGRYYYQGDGLSVVVGYDYLQGEGEGISFYSKRLLHLLRFKTRTQR